jgi:hypothetical protein
MKQSARCLFLSACLLTAARAQVTVEVAFDQDSYLPHESCLAEVRITNFSGRTLRMPAEADWLDLAVESTDGYIVAKLAEIPPAEAFEIPSAARGKRRVDLAPCFNLTEPGRYQVIATVRLRDLNLEVASAPAHFHIMAGTPLWEQAVGVPGGPAGQPPEVRRYALLQTNDRKRLALYARVTDETERRVYRVFPLGGLLSFGRPEAQVDRLARLHVLFQTGSRQFTYYCVSPAGEVLTRHLYQIAEGRPRLRLVEGGEIKVVGGFRLKSSYDIPSPPPDGSEATPGPVPADRPADAPAATPPSAPATPSPGPAPQS